MAVQYPPGSADWFRQQVEARARARKQQVLQQATSVTVSIPTDPPPQEASPQQPST